MSKAKDEGLGILDDIAEDEGDITAQGLLDWARLREAIAELKRRGINIRVTWLPILLAILAAIPDLMDAIQRFIDAIKKPTPVTP